jgi:hypothetical protein
MLKIMRSFQNFSNQQFIRFVPSHLPVVTMAASSTPKNQKKHQSSLLSQNNVGLEIGPAFSTR